MQINLKEMKINAHLKTLTKLWKKGSLENLSESSKGNAEQTASEVFDKRVDGGQSENAKALRMMVQIKH